MALYIHRQQTDTQTSEIEIGKCMLLCVCVCVFPCCQSIGECISTAVCAIFIVNFLMYFCAFKC